MLLMAHSSDGRVLWPANTSFSRSNAGAEVELEGGLKLQAKLVIAGDGVHSRSAAKYHKAALRKAPVGSWR